jgi:S1-C subfamily serine protease
MRLRRLVLGLLLLACGPKGRPDYVVPSDEDDPLARQPGPPASEPPAASPVGAAPAPPPAPVDVISTGAIPRAELAAVLDAGPSSFFQALAIEPSFAQDRFDGWEIRKLPVDGRFARVDLATGDVVVKVNGKLVQRPEEFQDLWESLRFAHELVVEYRRQGQPRELRFAITDGER